MPVKPSVPDTKVRERIRYHRGQGRTASWTWAHLTLKGWQIGRARFYRLWSEVAGRDGR